MQLIKQLKSIDLNDGPAVRRLLAGIESELNYLKRRGHAAELKQLQRLLEQFCSTNTNKNPSWAKVRASLLQFSRAVTDHLKV